MINFWMAAGAIIRLSRARDAELAQKGVSKDRQMADQSDRVAVSPFLDITIWSVGVDFDLVRPVVVLA